MAAGANNPLVAAGVVSTGGNIPTSDSVVTVPLYNGQVLCPGLGTCGVVNVNVVGFLKMFLQAEAAPQGTVYAYIIDITACGASSGGGSSPPPIVTGGGSPIPVRLIHQ